MEEKIKFKKGSISKPIDIDLNKSEFNHAKGLALHFLKKYDEAILFYDKAIEINSNESEYYYTKDI